MTPPKLAIVINLNQLEQLMKEYVAEEISGDEFVHEQLRLGHFLLWLYKRRQEEMDVSSRTDRT
ncbi:MAG TPA: hypothetical protein VL866_24470 [Pyrinomonadaceae bacterium]|nr:hypothetical protein [Pyrinomonadaceae bacterium]